MNKILDKTNILNYLKEIKPKYEQEGFIIKGLFGSYSQDKATQDSDIDILVEATPKFATKYGFQAVSRINQIKKELSDIFKIDVDLADSSGMSKTGREFIINRTIYV